MIAREGLIFILSGTVLTVISLLLSTLWDSRGLFILSLIFGLLTIFTTYFFRDPERQFENKPNILISPADGKIVGVDTVYNEFIGGEALKVSIFLSVFDVHVNRIPTNGVINYVKYNPGEFFPAFEDKASDKNEQTEIGMTTSEGKKIIFKQIAGIIARRIVCRLDENQKVTAGERFGIIRFGSRTELFVSINSKLMVKKGDRVKGSETVIGYLSGKEVNDVKKSASGKTTEL
ncbi:MAG: phosphatidylserine decarboxylase family protein [Candidatus Zixiibacteriota bacterium]|nr:MAG: phosphatidylserine decarboxylase family protein [candidate division Zixibacteria bacterium]